MNTSLHVPFKRTCVLQLFPVVVHRCQSDQGLWCCLLLTSFTSSLTFYLLFSAEKGMLTFPTMTEYLGFFFAFSSAYFYFVYFEVLFRCPHIYNCYVFWWINPFVIINYLSIWGNKPCFEIHFVLLNLTLHAHTWTLWCSCFFCKMPFLPGYIY